MQPGTKVKWADNQSGIVVDWKKFQKTIERLKAEGVNFDFKTQCLVRPLAGAIVAVNRDELTELVEGKELRKIVEGTVIQRWDKATGNFLGQEFVPGDIEFFEDENGNSIEPEDEPDHPFTMVQ